MKISKIVMGLLCLAVAACSSVSVETDYVQDRNFDSLKTFSWHPQSTDDELANGVSAIMDGRIRRHIQAQLITQGYELADANPDFFINYGVTTEDGVNIQVLDNYNGFGPSFGWRGYYGARGFSNYGGEVVVKSFKRGTLLIDVIEPAENTLIWRGMGSKELSGTLSAEAAEKLIEEVVVRVLENFPPKN